MCDGKRFSALRFAFAAAICLATIPSTARAVSVDFNQVSWGDGNGGYEAQNSQWGEATVSVSPSDIGSLSAFGSGYLGWVNIVTTVPGGSNNLWSVVNQPVVFDNPSDLGGNLPNTFKFDLTQPDGTPVAGLNYSLSLTPTPLSSQPGSPLTLAGVNAVTETQGIQSDPNAEGNFVFAPILITVGVAVAPFIANQISLLFPGRGAVQTPTTNVPAVNESENGCAPGAAARSIRYLGNMFPSLNVTQNAQQIYGTLTNLMMSNTGPASTNNGGTVLTNFVNGKNLYFTTNNLQIAPTVVSTSFGQAINALNATGDVELGVSWGISITNLPGGIIRTNFLGGHAVFVTGVTTVYTNGSIFPYRYIVDVVQDPNQGSGSLTNGTDRYVFDANGNLLNRGGMNARINSFRIEMATIPEPSTIELAGLAIGALALMHNLRRRWRT